MLQVLVFGLAPVGFDVLNERVRSGPSMAHPSSRSDPAVDEAMHDAWSQVISKATVDCGHAMVECPGHTTLKKKA